jgi:CheY-specific phosphatase CheX
MTEELETIDIVAKIFSQAVKKTLDKSTKKTIKYSKTIQSIPKVSLKPDIGCFVLFNGDYNGLVVMNFSSDAAMDLYTSYMTSMGLPESELAKSSTSNEVVDTIGEMTNQIMGRSVRMVENKYDLSSFFGQPKSLALSSAITLTPDLDYQDNRRISFSIGTNKFYMEVALEKTKFINV